jgi:5,10-methylenetetrahydrofolate reductase
VWVRIHKRTAHGELNLPPLLPSTDTALSNTSSYVNYFSGDDKVGRSPLAYPNLGHDQVSAPLQTLSTLEAKLKSGAFVKTCEVRSPRSADFTEMMQHALAVTGSFDAVNATAYLNGKPSMPSPVAAAKLAENGIEAIAQATARDHTKTSFISELLTHHGNKVNNILCLTGDSYKGRPRSKQVYDMDSSLMLYEARWLRDSGVIQFTGDALPDPPRLFLGAAINPFSSPPDVPLIRLKQKAAAGADFIQTQLVFDVEQFRAFMDLVRSERLDRDLFILAGVPVVTSRKALAVLPTVPGVHLPAEIARRLESATNIKREGVALAREIAAELSAMPGVAGVHLMLFGADNSVLRDVVRDLPAMRIGASIPGESPSAAHESGDNMTEEVCQSLV